ATKRDSMAFTPGGDTKKMTESIMRHEITRRYVRGFYERLRLWSNPPLKFLRPPRKKQLFCHKCAL
ncbi:MAG: hypothetical protein J0I92_12925, partial [Phyllobacterium sp.]|nr:hypothetical protein [Phyllobacterium sp.]